MNNSLELLCELYLRYGNDEAIPEEIRKQIGYQLGVVTTRQFLDVFPTEIGQLPNLEFHWCEPNIEAMISLDNDASTRETEAVRASKTSIEILQRPAEDINLIAVAADTAILPVSEILKRLSIKAKVEFRLAPQAQRAVVGRSSKLTFPAQSLALVTDQLLAPLGLMWNQVGDVVHVKEINADANAAVSYRFQSAVRMLKQVGLTFPDEVRKRSSLLHRGNLNLLANDLEAAENRFNELAELEPNGELSAKLSFNRAKLDLMLGQDSKAVERLFFSVDQSLNQHLQSNSYAWLGRVELENGNLQGAIYASSRGISISSDPLVRQNNVMTLAKSYMLESDPFSANKVLFENKDHIQSESAERLASVLGAYARFLGTTRSIGLRNEGERMIVALSAIKPEDVGGFIEQLLVGRAFFEVGFTGKATEMLQEAFDNARNEGWRRRIAFELGMLYYRAGELKKAETAFQTISVSLEDDAGTTALLQLAEIKLSSKQPELCLELCKRLWRMELSKEQKQRALEMMGQAYLKLQHPHAAAVCFSGMVPDEVLDSEPDSQVKLSSSNDGGQDP